MVSVGVSRMGKTKVVFVEPGTKIDSKYYCDNVMAQGLLPDIQLISITYVFVLRMKRP